LNQKIIEKAKYEPAIHNFLVLCEKGNMTYEEALESIVLYLCSVKEQLTSDLVVQQQFRDWRI
jgi:hypothetical protein